MEKFIDFIITQNCTYNCPYCSQNKPSAKDRANASKETIEAFLFFLDSIEKDYEITITGGEALLHPDFFNIINKIKNKGFKINLITNLSFEFDLYKKIFNDLNENLNNFDISLHLDMIDDFNILKEKLKNISLTKPKNTNIKVFIPIFNINNKKEEIIDSITSFLEELNIKYEFQAIRFLDKYQNQKSEMKYLKNIKPKKSYSNLCNAGYKSAVIYEDGNVYRCYSSRFFKTDYLGNIKDKNFKLNTNSKPCTKKYCTCYKPVLYNQIQDEKDLKKALYYNIINFIFLPFMIFKKRRTVMEKIKHYSILKPMRRFSSDKRL